MVSRRELLKGLGLAPWLFRPASFHGLPLFFPPVEGSPEGKAAFPFADTRLKPHYPASTPLADVLRLVAPGSDEYVTEKYAFELAALLQAWSAALRRSVRDTAGLRTLLDASLQASALAITRETLSRRGDAVEAARREFNPAPVLRLAEFVASVDQWLAPFTRVFTVEFEITGIRTLASAPLAVQLEVRYDLVGLRKDGRREERVGQWHMEWTQSHPADAKGWKVTRWSAAGETATMAAAIAFTDITAEAFSSVDSYRTQLLHGADYWRTVLDGACGIDVYGNNGVAAGDFDGDGFDDLYICQPAGLPNRLYRNRGDGTFEDVTAKAGVGVLDNTACALFADFRNTGLQDLLVVCGTGPLLFLNQGDGTFALKRDAFKFANVPQGSFTHAALIDYDRDGRLDIYFCLYSYYLGLDQYHYPVPYFDARNGPPNFLLHNEGDGTFMDRTEAAGMNVDNNRYSFACAWGETNADGLPDLYVANDFGRNSCYRNNGDGTFTSSATALHVEDVGAGMSACWSDIDNDGLPDIYAANMWSSAGQRVSGQEEFQPSASGEARELYRRHAHGNSLYRNRGRNSFENATTAAGVEMGRWAWCSDFWDFDHDGYADLYIANGYVSAPSHVSFADDSPFADADLGSFFWRQVVARSPADSTPSLSYEHGWNALNELIRSDRSWSGQERNVFFVNNRDGTFSEASGTLGLDFPEDGRSFALADIDHDGRLEIILKNRNAPQLRILHNDLDQLGHSIAFRLRGTKSNRDAIGAAVTVVAGALRQTRYLQAGSGFLAQHSKEVFFGLGAAEEAVRATVRWPSGLVQVFEGLPLNQRISLEEGSPSFTAKPFVQRKTSRQTAAPLAVPEAMPTVVETWLIDPLKAPGFSLPDISHRLHPLEALRGKPVLLTFWSAAAPASLQQLKALRQITPVAALVSVLAVNIDTAAAAAQARLIAAGLELSFPVVFANEEMAGVYNLIYRYLYDRRRDLPIPSSLLLDKDGTIVKAYQGPVLLARIAEDAASIPTTEGERIRKSLPFPGVVYQGSFQRNDFTYGVAMFQHGFLEQAAESFKQVVAAKPDSAEALYNLGTLNLRQNHFAQARDYLQQTLKLRAEYPEAWNNLGMMAAQEGRPEEAIQNFKQALQQRPGYAVALLNLGNVYRRQGAAGPALQALTQALALQPDDPEIQYSLGMFHAQQGEMQAAADYLAVAIRLRPEYPEAMNNLGVLYVRQREYVKAEEEFRTCIRMAPAFDQSYINLARLYALQNDRPKAEAALQDLLRLQPENINAIKAMEMLKAMP